MRQALPDCRARNADSTLRLSRRVVYKGTMAWAAVDLKDDGWPSRHSL